MKDAVKKIIEDIFLHTNSTLSSCECIEDGPMIWFSVETPDSRYLIGRDGETLRSLNHLVRKMAEKTVHEEEATRIFVDINGYQKKQFDALRATAHMMAERARYFKSSISIDPMSAFERRIIHMFLQGQNDIQTESEGVGSDRHVVIRYIGGEGSPTV